MFRTKSKLFALLALAFGMMLFRANVCFADGLIIIDEIMPRPPHWPPPRYVFSPLEVKYHHVTVNVTDQVAVTEIQQSFYNPNNARLEGTYVFPVPEGARIDKFSMDINGKEVQAELLDADKARSIYEDIVRRMKDPALLEYAGQKMFKVRIYPIEPKSEKKVRMKYTELLKSEGGLIEYRYPLNTEKFSSKPLNDVSVKVELESTKQIKTIYSPSHKVEISRPNQKKAIIGYEDANVKPDTDFQLFFAPDPGDDIGVQVLTFNNSTDSEGGHFLLTASPATETTKKDIIAKDVVFVLDTSGSMAEKGKMEQAKKALKFCLRNLNREDQFEIVRFSTEAEQLFSDLKEPSEQNLSHAQSFVDELKPIGGTAIEEGLLKAIAPAKSRANKERPYYVVFLTDGRPTIGTVNEEQIVDKVTSEIGEKGIRIFSFGVGTDIDVHLLDRLRDNTSGASQFVLPDEDIEVKVSNFYTKINEPVLSNLKLEFSGSVRATKLHPAKLPDLFKGEQLLILGRYKGDGHAAITLKGEVNGSPRSFTYEANFPAKAEEYAFIPALWATRRVGFLLDQIRLHGENKELREEVVELARRYGIVTPYTAYLIVEDEAQRNVPMPLRALPSIRERREVHRRMGEVYQNAREEKSGWAALDTSDALTELEGASYAGAAGRSNKYAMRAPSGTAGHVGTEIKQAMAKQESRSIGGKTFYLNANRWVDGDIQTKPEAKHIKVEFGSSDYFSLLKKHKNIAKWLSLGTEVEVLVNDTIYEIASDN